MKFVVLALTTSVLLQGPASPAKDLLNLQRQLTAAEIETVVGEIRQALAGKTLRLVGDRYGSREILVGQDGLPRMMRIVGAGERIATVTVDGGAGPRRVPTTPEREVWLIEYTAIPARRCDGGPATGDMVIEYLLNTTTQARTITARERRPGDMDVVRPLEMLMTTASLKSGETRLIGNRTARAIVSPLSLSNPTERRIAGDPAPDRAEFVPLQTLWIDTNSLLPLRWEVSERQAITGAVDVVVHEPFDLQRPAGVQVPTCVPEPIR